MRSNKIHKSKAAVLLCLAWVMFLLMGVVAGTKPAEAQVSGATLSGVVTDLSGALVPNAAIAISNTDTGATRNITSNAEGFYSAPNLNPGNYEVKVSAKGFSTTLQKGIVLTVSSEQTFSPVLNVGKFDQIVVVSTAPPSIQSSASTLSGTVDGTTVRELPLNGRDWTTLATLEPGVLSVPNQATTGFSANKGNRGFGNQLSDGGHRPNENTYRVNGMVINDYTNAAPGGATGVNLGVDAIDQFSVLTSSYTSEYGRTSGAVIDAITRSGTNKFHGTAYFFDRDKIFDARNYFEPTRSPFRRIQFGGAVGGPIYKNRTFFFVDYEGIRQSQPVATTIKVPNAGARAAAVPAIVPYLALWPVAPAGSPDTNPGGIGVQSFNVAQPTKASENYVIGRLDHKFSSSDTIDGTYFFDSGPQTQVDPLGNTVHQVFSRRQLYTAEETHVFNSAILNTFRGGVSLITGLINDPVSGSAAGTNAKLAVAPGSVAPPQLPVSGLTTAYGLGGFNKFNHDWQSIQFYDDAFITKGNHSMKVGGAFENMHYDVLEQLSPNGRFNTYTLAKFLANAPNKLNALAPGGSHQVAFRENLFAAYFQDDWHIRKNLTLNLGLRYEATTRPTDANTVPSYTVNGYTVAAAGFQQITTLSNCSASSTACGPVGTDSPIASNPTTKNFQPRLGFAWDPFGDGKTAVHAAFGMFDVLPLPYEFGLNTAATAPFQIVGADPATILGTGVPDANINFNQSITLFYQFQSNVNGFLLNVTANVAKTYTNSMQIPMAVYTIPSCPLGATPFSPQCPGLLNTGNSPPINPQKGRVSFSGLSVPVSNGMWIGIAVSANQAPLDLNDTNTNVQLFQTNEGRNPAIIQNPGVSSCACKIGLWAWITGSIVTGTPPPSSSGGTCGPGLDTILTCAVNSLCTIVTSQCQTGSSMFLIVILTILSMATLLGIFSYWLPNLNLTTRGMGEFAVLIFIGWFVSFAAFGLLLPYMMILMFLVVAWLFLGRAKGSGPI